MWEKMKEKRNEGGFTLIELLIVIVVLAILAAIVVFAVGTTTSNAKQAACNSDAKSVETAVEAYKASEPGWPSTFADLTTVTNGKGPWLRQAPPATVANNGYAILDTGFGTGVVNVQTAAGTIDFDTETSTTGCNAIP
jgi:general secretion pathway protein G